MEKLPCKREVRIQQRISGVGQSYWNTPIGKVIRQADFTMPGGQPNVPKKITEQISKKPQVNSSEEPPF